MTGEATVLHIVYYLLIVPILTFCWLPLRKHFKVSPTKLYVVSVSASTIFALAIGLLSYFVIPIHPIIFLAFTYIIAFVVFYFKSKIEWYKILCLFIDNFALISCAQHVDRCIDVYFNRNGYITDLSLYGVIFEWIFLLAILLIFIKSANSKFTWLITHFNNFYLYLSFGIILFVIAFTNYLMMPSINANMFIGSIYSVEIIGCVLLFTLFLLSNIVFYVISHGIYESEKATRRNDFLQIQASQYARLKSYMEETAQIRHDFRHSLRTITQMAESSDLNGIKDYLKDYNKKQISDKPQIYCENPAINALLNYYCDFAKKIQIELTIKTVFHRHSDISDVDLCSVLGNLMENAIHACQLVNIRNRFIKLSASLDGSNNIYIVCTNSFLKDEKKNETNSSKLYESHGIGLTSIEAIAESYHGFSKAYPLNENVFCVDVLLKSAEPLKT